MALTAVLILVSLALFTLYWLKSDEKASEVGLEDIQSAAVVLQAIVLALLFYQDVKDGQ